MSGDGVDRALVIMGEALDVDPAEREAFLDSRCGDDSELRKRVDALLEHECENGEGNFLGGGPLLAVRFEEEDEFVGKVVLGYELKECIDHGGQGRVYRSPGKGKVPHRVAVKILNRGIGVSAERVIRRFDNEVEIYNKLGGDPGIVHVLEVGLAGPDRPCIVMEYIDGMRIDNYCDDKRLTVEERVDLLIKVLKSLEYAHSNLVAHRDVKPSNILVGDDGQPKLLDFGIAKILEGEAPQGAGRVRAAEETETVVLLSKAYASPEQLEGTKVLTTATDLYSLGVVACEVLFGWRPDPVTASAHPGEKTSAPTSLAKAAAGSQRSGVDWQPLAQKRKTSPRALRRRLFGDLEAILSRALEREPAKRYDTAGKFRADLERFLAGEPLRYARTSTRRERAQKWARRNRMPISVAAMVLLVVLFATYQTLRNASHQAEAQQRRQEVLRGTQESARLLASELSIRLNALKQRVADATIELRGIFEVEPVEISAVQEKLDDTMRFHSNPGGESAFGSWAAYDETGTLLAVSRIGDPDQSSSSIDWGDPGLLDGARSLAGEFEDPPVYLSQLFFDEQVAEFILSKAVIAKDRRITGFLLGTVSADFVDFLVGNRQGLDVIVATEVESTSSPDEGLRLFVHPGFRRDQARQSVSYASSTIEALLSEPSDQHLDPFGQHASEYEALRFAGAAEVSGTQFAVPGESGQNRTLGNRWVVVVQATAVQSNDLEGSVQASSGRGDELIASGREGGLYIQVARAIAEIIGRSDLALANGGVGLTSGSVFNINAVLSGAYLFGLAQGDRQFQAWQGTSEWLILRQQQELRHVLTLYTEAVTLVVAEDSVIHSIDDLPGRSVSIGTMGSGQRQNSLDVLALLGAKKSHVDIRNYDIGKAKRMLQTGEIDAFFYTIGQAGREAASA